MVLATREAELSESGAGTTRRCDRGSSLVEILIAITLLGITVVGVITALRVTTSATALERDHAKAYQWLQSATGVLQSADRVSCDLGEPTVRDTYEQVLRDDVISPPGWQDVQLTVREPVKVWDGATYWNPAAAPKPCYDSDGFKLQLITIQVKSPNGRIVETLQVVKDG